ncbi:amidinotransferase, partial [Escherichia coli]|nr:amidinotransferase [Escherichia coli]
SVSLRLNEKLFREFCEKFGYTPIVFHSYQTAGTERLPIYHTNVMMCVADRFVVICLDCIDDLDERQNVIDTIKKSGKEIIEISEEQMQNFAG